MQLMATSGASTSTQPTLDSLPETCIVSAVRKTVGCQFSRPDTKDYVPTISAAREHAEQQSPEWALRRDEAAWSVRPHLRQPAVPVTHSA